MTQIKRQTAAVRAMQRTTTPVRLVIAGRPESTAYENQLRSFVRTHSLELKSTSDSGGCRRRIKSKAPSARCLAVAYTSATDSLATRRWRHLIRRRSS